MENCVNKEMHTDFLARYITSILHFLLCLLYLNLFKCLGAGIVGEYGGMEKEKKEKEICFKKEIHVDFPARYFPSILHFFLCSLYLNLFKGLGAGIVGEYGGMKLEEGVEGRGASLLGSDHQEVWQTITALLLRPKMDKSQGSTF